MAAPLLLLDGYHLEAWLCIGPGLQFRMLIRIITEEQLEAEAFEAQCDMYAPTGLMQPHTKTAQ